ncbi:putative ACR [uncultured archaeon]|nr:putative ACR [uncultured archaeon]
MRGEEKAIRLRIYLGESDQHGKRPLYQHLLEYFRQKGLAGCTVIRALSGFGHSSRLHTLDVLRLSSDLPVVLEVVDKAEKVDPLLPSLREWVRGGLITREEVHILHYTGVRKG